MLNIIEKLQDEGLNLTSRSKLQKELKILEKEEQKLLGLPKNNDNSNNNANNNNNNVNNLNKLFTKLKLNIKKTSKTSTRSNKKGPKTKTLKKNVPKSHVMTRAEKKYLEKIMNEENTNTSEKYRKARNAEINRKAKTKKNNNKNNE